MTKKEARELLVQMEVIEFAVLASPDWCGGAYPDVRIKTPNFNAIPAELDDYQYNLFCGDTSSVMHNLNKKVGEFRDPEDYKAGEYDYYITIGEAIEMAADKYLY